MRISIGQKYADDLVDLQISTARDSRLSHKARGLYAELMSYPRGQKFSVRWISRQNGVGRDAINSAIAELEKYGYIVDGIIQQNPFPDGQVES
jgi:hypothetical protein